MNELSQTVEEMRNMREAYDQLGAAAEAYNTGKTELAANLTSKGVDASATETLPELAEKVNAISQETYEINGGEMYAKQLFGSLTTPNYWNLYDILAQLLSDGRFVNYGGILLAEYYRGYDSLALSGAGAGGAYVVSDFDENGQFKMYTNDTTHTWATEFDGKGNRWVAYCFADEYHNFQITDTNTSPRSIFIGRKVGTITCLVNTRISQIVVPDGNKLRKFDGGSYSHNFGQTMVVNSEQAPFITNFGNTEKAYFNVQNWEGSPSWSSFGGEVLIKVNGELSGSIGRTQNANAIQIIDCETIPLAVGLFQTGSGGSQIKTAIIITERMSSIGQLRCNTLYLQYKTNDKSKTVNIGNEGLTISGIMDIILKDGWCKPLTAPCTSLTKENVQAHIFDRLGVNDLSTGAVTITLASAVLNLFTQEEIDAVVERTNITIVGA